MLVDKNVRYHHMLIIVASWSISYDTMEGILKMVSIYQN